MSKSKGSANLQLESQRLYSYWQAIIYSFFSHPLYWDVYKRWRGIGIIYLLLMTSILSIPYGVKTTLAMRDFFNEELIPPIKLIPDIYYINGKLVFDKKMPYLIKNERGQVKVIVDDTGKFTELDMKEYPDVTFLFMKDKIKYSLPDASNILRAFKTPEPPKVRTIDAPKDVTLVMNGQWFLDGFHINNLKNFTLTTIYPIVASTFFSVTIVFLLPIAMMGQVVSQTIFKIKLYYKQSCRLLCVASTPAFFILQVMAVCRYYESAIGLVWISLMALYFSFVMIILKRNLRSIARL